MFSKTENQKGSEPVRAFHEAMEAQAFGGWQIMGSVFFFPKRGEREVGISSWMESDPRDLASRGSFLPSNPPLLPYSPHPQTGFWPTDEHWMFF